MGGVDQDKEVQSLFQDGVNQEDSVPDVNVQIELGRLFDVNFVSLDRQECLISYPDSPLTSDNPEKEPQSSKGKGVNSPDSNATSCPWDPFYPYVHCLPAPQPTFTTSGECCTRPAEILVWRALVHSETGVECRLQKYFKPQFVENMLKLYNEGIDHTYEEGDQCLKAAMCFIQVRSNLMLFREQLEEQDYEFLLAWANLPLAQLYQSVGSAEMLKDAMYKWKEVLHCVLPLQGSHELLVRVCKTYYYTAQYEWGAAVMSLETKNEAIQDYATLMMCYESEAEAQLCFLLCVDHEYSLSFEQSLRWIREANRLWKSNYSLDAGKDCKFYFLHYEAKLLMKLGNYGEAVKVLEDLTLTTEYVFDLEHPKLALKVHKMLEDCYTEMSKRALVNNDFFQQAVDYEELAELQRCFQRSLGGAEDVYLVPIGVTDQFLEVPNSYIPQTWMRKPCAVGSSLGLVQACHDKDFLFQAKEKLPDAIISNLQYRLMLAKKKGSDNWKGRTLDYEQIRELLKLTKRHVDKSTFDWMLSWVDLPLAQLYHFHARNLVKAIKIFKEMLDCAWHLMGSDKAFLTQGYESMYLALLLEQEVEKDPDSVNLPDPRGGRLAVRKMLFWLYFGHYKSTNWKIALKWLQEAQRLKELCVEENHDCANIKGEEYHYFWSDFIYLLCEADLLMRLQKFEEATVKLQKLLSTTHVQEGSQVLAREANKMLKYCSYMQSRTNISGDDGELAELQGALEYNLIADNHKKDETAEQRPSSAGIIFKSDFYDPFKLTDTLQKSVQSQVGLEHHLHKLPVSFHLAFRMHFMRGCSHFEHAEWEKAIFDFEWCKEILKLVMMLESENPEAIKSCHWLMVWASFPLANIYSFKTKQFREAIDLLVEMDSIIHESGNSNEFAGVNMAIYMSKILALYQLYSVSEWKNPYLKNFVVRDFATVENLQDDGESENYILTQLSHTYKHYGNSEIALHLILEAKQYLSRYDDNRMALNFAQQAICYKNLGMHQEAENVIKEYYITSGKKKDDLSPFMRSMVDVFSKDERLITRSDLDKLDELCSVYPAFLSKLKVIKKIMDFSTESIAKTVQWYEETYVELMDKTGNESEMEMASHSKLDHQDYSLLAAMRTRMCLKAILSFEYLDREQIKAIGEDSNFKRAVAYCEKCIELSAMRDTSDRAVVQAKISLAILYSTLDIQYFNYISKFLVYKVLDSMNGNSHDVVESAQQSLFCQYLDDLNYYSDSKWTPLPRYGKEIVTDSSSFLHNVENTRYSDDQWLQLLGDHEVIYYHLQDYYFGRATCYIALSVLNRDSGYEKQIDTCYWNALMYAEGERTQSMLYQLLDSNKLNSSYEWGFDASDDHALEAIKQKCATLLKGDTVFVQYSCFPQPPIRSFLIYVMDQDDKLSVTKVELDHQEEELTGSAPKRSRLQKLEDRLKTLYRYLEQGFKNDNRSRSYNSDTLKEDLEFLHDLLIKPIAAKLNKMEPHHKLILAPNELLTKVPFAALRDKTTGKYLVESHTISVTPSLRVLQACTERLQELRSSPPYTGLGSIVALGDPAYECPKCTRPKRRSRLVGTGEEVEHIAELFGETAPVVKLLQGNATAKQLLHWAAQPSQASGFRQAIVHIGAHGMIDVKDHKKNVLLMACDPTRLSPNHLSLPRSDGASTSFGGRGQSLEAGLCSSDEEENDSDDEVDSTMNRSISMSDRFIRSTLESMFIHTGESGPVLTSENGSSNRRGSADPRENSHDLWARDISSSELKWRAELVVLSACQTSRGRVTKEGVLSMARTFMIAGVPCIVASLWKVDDKATVELMKVFYKELRKGKDVASALRSAMLARIRAHPEAVREWAPFNVWGVPSLCVPKELQQK